MNTVTAPLRIAFVASVSMLFASQTHAATVTFYTDLASFQAVTSTSLIDFEGIVGDTEFTIGSLSEVIGGVTFSVPSTLSAGILFSGKDSTIFGAPFNSAMIVSSSGDPVTPITADLTSAGSGFTAVGGFFGDLASTNSTTLTLTGGSGVLDTRTVTAGDMGFGNPIGFYGWTITGDTILSVKHDLTNSFEALDDFRFGTFDSLGPVPLPGTIWLLGSGLIGLFGFAKKRKK